METLANNLGCSLQACLKKFQWKKKGNAKGRKKEKEKEEKEEKAVEEEKEEEGENTEKEREEDKKARIAGGLRNVIKGKTVRKDGTPYSKFYTTKIWRGLEDLVRSPEMFQALAQAKSEGSPELFKVLMGKDVCTLTGR